MHHLFERLRRHSAAVIADQTDRALQHTCMGRIVSALTFITIVVCLILWTTLFLLFQGSRYRDFLPAAIFTDLLCVAYFGGILAAIVIGGLVGNFLRRASWNILLKRKK